jgi:hypothetical protein
MHLFNVIAINWAQLTSTGYVKLSNELGRTGTVAVIANQEGDVRGM